MVANALSKLRTALGEPDAARIVTLPRIGYRFDGPLERVAVGWLTPSVLGLDPGQPVPGRASFLLDERIGQSASNEVWLFRGAEDLGTLAGGVFRYVGSASVTNFHSTYDSKSDRGTFDMRRP